MELYSLFRDIISLERLSEDKEHRLGSMQTTLEAISTQLGEALETQKFMDGFEAKQKKEEVLQKAAEQSIQTLPSGIKIIGSTQTAREDKPVNLGNIFGPATLFNSYL